MYTNEKDVKVCFFVANVCFCHKSLFFRVTEVCFCLFFKENMVRIWSVFFKIRSVLIIGDTGVDRFTLSALNLKPCKPHYMLNSEKSIDSSQSFNNFQQLVHATSNGFVLHPNTSFETQVLLGRLPR